MKNESYYVLATRFVYQDDGHHIDVIGKRCHVIEVANFDTSSFKLVLPIEVEQFEIKLPLNKCNHNNCFLFEVKELNQTFINIPVL